MDVTEKDIDQALVKNSSRCVVATAIARSIPGANRIQVDVQSIRFSLEGERHVYLTPYAVAGYVVAFDAGDDIHPFRFQLREDQKRVARQAKRTPAGVAVDRARTAARDSKKREAAAQQKLEMVQAAPPAEKPAPAVVKRMKQEVEMKREEAVEAAAERDAVIAAYAGHRKVDRDYSLPPAPPKVFKLTERAYGMRQLRVNGGGQAV